MLVCVRVCRNKKRREINSISVTGSLPRILNTLPGVWLVFVYSTTITPHCSVQNETESQGTQYISLYYVLSQSVLLCSCTLGWNSM